MSTKMPADLRVGDLLAQVDMLTGATLPPLAITYIGPPQMTLTAQGYREIREITWEGPGTAEQPFVYTDVPVEVVP